MSRRQNFRNSGSGNSIRYFAIRYGEGCARYDNNHLLLVLINDMNQRKHKVYLSGILFTRAGPPIWRAQHLRMIWTKCSYAITLTIKWEKRGRMFQLIMPNKLFWMHFWVDGVWEFIECTLGVFNHRSDFGPGSHRWLSGTKGGAANQITRSSSSSNAREPGQPPIKPQSNKLRKYKRLLVLTTLFGKKGTKGLHKRSTII